MVHVLDVYIVLLIPYVVSKGGLDFKMHFPFDSFTHSFLPLEVLDLDVGYLCIRRVVMGNNL